MIGLRVTLRLFNLTSEKDKFRDAALRRSYFDW